MMFDMVCRHSTGNADDFLVLVELDRFLSFFKWNRDLFARYIICAYELEESRYSRIREAIERHVITIIEEV